MDALLARIENQRSHDGVALKRELQVSYGTGPRFFRGGLRSVFLVHRIQDRVLSPLNKVVMNGLNLVKQVNLDGLAFHKALLIHLLAALYGRGMPGRKLRINASSTGTAGF